MIHYLDGFGVIFLRFLVIDCVVAIAAITGLVIWGIYRTIKESN